MFNLMKINLSTSSTVLRGLCIIVITMSRLVKSSVAIGCGTVVPVNFILPTALMQQVVVHTVVI
jgi:hypothetical protein